MNRKHESKYALGLSGEFLVAGELLRRGISAAVTYGNAKKADVVIFNEKSACQLEVKTTSSEKWVIGSNLPENEEQIWVLVYLSPELKKPPVYHVIVGEELRKLILPKHEAYGKRYKEKYGKDYSGKGVVSINRSLLPAESEGNWEIIIRAI